jgi:hypothetical protein
VNPQSAAIRNESVPPFIGQRTRQPPRPRYFWPRTLAVLTRHTVKTTPWVTLASGCVAGTAILAALAYVAHKYHNPLGQTTVRFTMLPAIATLAFVPRTPFRPLTHTTPIRAWLASAIQTFLASIVLAVTCVVQLRLMAYTMPSHTVAPAVYPLMAELSGWSAIFVVAAACCDRSRFADVGGAIAAAVGFVAIALAWEGPWIRKLFVAPPATQHAATIAWYILTAGALALAYAAMRDRWHRYTRNHRRLRAPASGRRPGRSKLTETGKSRHALRRP